VCIVPAGEFDARRTLKIVVLGFARRQFRKAARRRRVRTNDRGLTGRGARVRAGKGKWIVRKPGLRLCSAESEYARGQAMSCRVDGHGKRLASRRSDGTSEANMSNSKKLSDVAPKVESLKRLVEFQEKSVVSRMLVKRGGGSVTMFAFDGGEGLSEHTAPFDALVIGVEGAADIQVGGVTHRVAEGETLLMPANVPHAVAPAGPFKMLLVMIRDERPA
jgi:quercetin dioxygenase-like cupin family protein